MRCNLLVLSVSSIALAAPAAAAEHGDVEAAPTAQIGAAAAATAAPTDDIIVEGERSSYGASALTSAMRTRTDVRNIPQALTVITKAQIDDQQLRSVADLLTFVPGASPATGEGHRDQIVLRGNNSTADFFVDGMRDDVQYFRDFYNVARVEVLKGPNAMIFGRGGGGGIINRVVKKTNFGQLRSLDLVTTSKGGLRAMGDIDQPIGPSAGIRVNALYENSDSFRRNVELKRAAINPTIGAMVGADTRIDLGYEFLRDRRTVDRGVPSLTRPAGVSEPLRGFDRVFFGDPDDSFARTDVHLGTAEIAHEFGNGLTLRNRSLIGDYDKFYQNIYPANLDEALSQVVLGAYNSATRRTNVINQTDLVWDNRLAGIDQTLLVGAEFGRQLSRNRRLTGSFAGSNRAPLADPTVDVDVTFAPSASDSNNRTRATTAAVYAQQQLRPSHWLEIVAGLRFDRFSLRVKDFRASGGTFERTDTLVSPRLGLIVKPNERLSVYSSYSRSYLPQSGDQFSGLDVTSAALKPEKFENYELGAKWEPLAGLLATAAVYQLDQTNSRASDPANPGQVVLTGAQRTRGLEVGLERSITHRWQISGGYALQDSEITRATAAAPEGRKVPLVPRHTAAVWSKYQATPSVAFGLGLLARSKSYASLSNQVKLPGYARVDAAAYYTLAPGVEAQLNVENLFGTDYFSAAHNDNNIAPGAPRTARLRLNFGL